MASSEWLGLLARSWSVPTGVVKSAPEVGRTGWEGERMGDRDGVGRSMDQGHKGSDIGG